MPRDLLCEYKPLCVFFGNISTFLLVTCLSSFNVLKFNGPMPTSKVELESLHCFHSLLDIGLKCY